MPNISSLQIRKEWKSGGGQVQQQRDQTGEQQLGGHARPLPGAHLVILIPTFQTCSYFSNLSLLAHTCPAFNTLAHTGSQPLPG